MIENYKNTLADKYMRDTNYILIKDTDDMDDLEAQWNKFCSFMTVRQQRLSDDKSIELWNMTNQKHYEQIKERLLSKLKEKDIAGDKQIHPNINDNPEFESIEDNDELDSGRYLTFEELEKDYNEVYNESIVNTKDDNINELQDDPNNNNADLYNQNSNIKIIGSIKGDTPEEKLKNLEDEFIRYNSQSHDIRKKADDQCRSLYGGVSNLDRYNKIKGELLTQINDVDKDQEKEFISSVNTSKNTEEIIIDKTEKECRCRNTIEEIIQADQFLSKCYNEYKLNSINEAVKHKKMKRLEDLPYFTPQELIDLGVHGNNNYYSRMADNDGLTKDVSVSTWFDSYKDISMNHIFEDYRKEWINKLNELYSDYYDLTDEDEILARKQSILDLGWNPEIPFTSENRLKATDRVNKIFQDTVPEDIFIDMSNVPELGDELYNEMVNPSDQEPVFLILTKGKTPVISHGIKFVTKSEYSHASITFDPELKEAYSFNMRKQNWGFIRETLESFKDNVISVFAFFAPKNIVTKLKKTVYDFANHETNFDLRIFANKIFHINHKVSNNEYNQVCSTFVDTVLKSGGINLVGNQQIPSPADIYNGAKSQPNKIFEVYYGIAPKYNGKKVKNQINYLVHSEDTLSINENYYRITYNNNGIYEELKKAMYQVNNDSSEWDKFKKSKECTWLPLPPKYSSKNNSYFTKEGYDKFMKLTYPVIIKYLDKNKIRIDEYDSIDNIEYKDKYQIVSINETSDIYYNDEYISEGDDYMLETNLPEGVTLRNANKDDTENMFKWEIESVDKRAKNDPKVIKFIKKDVQDSIKDTKMIMYKDETIGMLTTCPIDGGEYWYIGEIYIINKYRNKGIGSTLLKNEISKHNKIKLQVGQSNTSAIRLYKSLGFKIIDKNDEGKFYIMVLDKTDIKESVSYFNEAKKFPVEFDDDGNLTIYKCRMGNISYGDEIDDSVQLLESYRNTSNAEGIKYELARLWFIISDIEKKMTKRIDSKTYDGYVRNRATAMNVFKTNLEYLMKIDNTFNFAEYYNTTPFSDNSIKITNNTLKYSFKALKNFIMK